MNQLTEEIRKSLEEASGFEGIWGKIRRGLIDYYGTGGDAMDNAWFGKLTANVDADSKKLTLKAPSQFIKDWVQSNYTHLIDKLCSLHSYSLEGVQYA
jgi:chromosomal replication initiation ATPase DnaA